MLDDSLNSSIGAGEGFSHQPTYQLFLTLKYPGQIEDHQKLSLIGGIEELGDWNTPKVFLKHLKDDVWTLEKLLVTQKQYFMCKFAIVENEDDM